MIFFTISFYHRDHIIQILVKLKSLGVAIGLKNDAWCPLPVLLELSFDTLRDASDYLGSMNEIRGTIVEFQEHLNACA